MKEAAGEANMTVITIVLIGIVLVAGGVIVRSLLAGQGRKACEESGGTWCATCTATVDGEKVRGVCQ